MHVLERLRLYQHVSALLLSKRTSSKNIFIFWKISEFCKKSITLRILWKKNPYEVHSKCTFCYYDGMRHGTILILLNIWSDKVIVGLLSYCRPLKVYSYRNYRVSWQSALEDILPQQPALHSEIKFEAQGCS